MLIPEEYVEILVELGLTHTEAKVYLSLLCLGGATARTIHSESKIARQDVYRILSDLEEKELIEKVIVKPVKFRPIAIKDTISILLRRKKEQFRQLRKKAIRHFRNFQVDCVTNMPFNENAQFILLSRSETNPTGRIDKPGKAIDSAKKSVMGLITIELFMKIKLMDEYIWKKAVKRGVKFKFMISERPTGKAKLALDPVLKGSGNFEVRWTSRLPAASVLVVDDNEAFCRVGVSAENPVLWSADPNFVSMIKDYLEMKWKSLE